MLKRQPPRQYVRREEDGHEYRGTSESCPKCGHHSVTKKISPEATFDEGGWFYANVLSCDSPRCNHSWTEKQSVLQDNKPLR